MTRYSRTSSKDAKPVAPTRCGWAILRTDEGFMYLSLLSMTETDHCAENVLAGRMNGRLKSEYGLDQRYNQGVSPVADNPVERFAKVIN